MLWTLDRSLKWVLLRLWKAGAGLTDQMKLQSKKEEGAQVLSIFSGPLTTLTLKFGFRSLLWLESCGGTSVPHI